MRIQIKSIRLIIASVIGSLFSLFIFTDQRSIIYAILLRIISTTVITIIAFRPRSFSNLLRAFVAVILVSMLFSGLMILIYSIFHPPNMMIINDIVYLEFDPLVLVFITIVIYAAIYLFIKRFRPHLSTTVVKLSFTVREHTYCCVGKIDTGCTLREPFSDDPVIVVDKEIFQPDEHEERRIIPYTALGKASVLFGVKADSVRIEEKLCRSSAYIAAADLHNSAYQAIINSDIMIG